MIGSVTESTASVWTIPGQVGKLVTEGVVVADAVILGVARGSLVAAGTFVLQAINMEMPSGMALTTMSLVSHDRFWAQLGISRCSLSGVGSGTPLKSDSS